MHQKYCWYSKNNPDKENEARPDCDDDKVKMEEELLKKDDEIKENADRATVKIENATGVKGIFLYSSTKSPLFRINTTLYFGYSTIWSYSERSDQQYSCGSCNSPWRTVVYFCNSFTYRKRYRIPIVASYCFTYRTYRIDNYSFCSSPPSSALRAHQGVRLPRADNG